MTVPPSIIAAENFIRSGFFCEKTNLFYDYLVHNAADPLISHLPTPYEISCLIPNACGWGTGMEDSMLSAGTMMEAVLAEYTVTGDPALPDFAAKIADGMAHCAEAAKRDGFLPRSVSPVDGVSHYINSSRDQYTHFILGALLYLRSGLASPELRERLERALVSFARRCEADVTAENNYAILREDGGPSMVQEMWGNVGIEGALRMVLMFAAAHEVSGDAHWREMLLRYRDEGIRRSMDVEQLNAPIYAMLQMQYSVRLLHDLEPDPTVRERYRELMRRIAAHLPDPCAAADRVCADPEHLTFPMYPWNRVKAYYIGSIGGLNWYNPGQSELWENRGFYEIRGVGEIITARALRPGYRVSDDEISALVRVAGVIDYAKHCSYAPMALVNAYWVAAENRLSGSGSSFFHAEALKDAEKCAIM